MVAWLALTLFLQTPSAAPPKPFPLESMRVDGNVRYPASQILALTGLKIGQMVESKAFDLARDRLMESGAFATVGYSFAPSESGKGYALTFEVAEIAQVYPVRFDRLPAPEKEVRAWLKSSEPMFGDAIPATKTLIARYVATLEKFFAGRGNALKVAGRVTSDNPAEPYVLFHPAGAPPVVAEVRFVNTKVLAAEALQRAFYGVAIGTEFREGTFRQMLDATIRPLYEERGRVRVAFPKISSETAREVKGVAVTVEVDEGPSYNVGEVKLEGAGAAKQLLDIADLRTGDMFNLSDAEAGRQRVESALRRNGHMQVRSRWERNVDDTAKKIDLVLHVEPGALFVFGKLFVQGLDITTEPAVRKMWAMEPGKPYNPEYPNFFLNRIREGGLFDNLGKTKADVKVNDKTGTVDVTLVFYRAAQKPEPKL